MGNLLWKSLLVALVGLLLYQTQFNGEFGAFIKSSPIYINIEKLIRINFPMLKEDDIFELAKINLTRAEESEDGFKEVSKELYSAFNSVGFAYVTDLKGFDPDELLYWTKWFYNLPEKDKLRITRNTFVKENPNRYRGFFPRIPGGHSFKEAFEIGTFNRKSFTKEFPEDTDLVVNQTKIEGKLYTRNIVQEMNSWPITGNKDKDEAFRLFMQDNYKLFQNACLLIMQMLATGLGFERTKFDNMFGSNQLSTKRLIHYPTRLHAPETIPSEAWDGDKAIVTGEHFDSGILTILATFENAGLQIKPHGFSKWIDVPAMKNNLVINIGALLADIVEDRLVATNHRVLDIGVERFSVPFFLEPQYDGDISRTVYGKKVKSVGKLTKYGPYMTNRTRMFAEYSKMDWGILD